MFQFTGLCSSLASAVHWPLQFTDLCSSLASAVYWPVGLTGLCSSLASGVHRPLQFTGLCSSLASAVHWPLQFTDLCSSPASAIHRPLQFTGLAVHWPLLICGAHWMQLKTADPQFLRQRKVQAWRVNHLSIPVCLLILKCPYLIRTFMVFPVMIMFPINFFSIYSNFVENLLEKCVRY